MSKISIKETVISAVSLAIIAGGIAAALAWTNALTKPTIDKKTEEAETAARRQVIDADSFNKKTIESNGQKVVYYEAEDGDSVVGYVFTVTSTGKSSGLVVMTGISSNGEITGVAVTDDNETAGYVEKVEKAGLLDGFKNKKTEKEFKLGENIDGVSQATKTSKGVTDGVNEAVKYFKACIKEGK